MPGSDWSWQATLQRCGSNEASMKASAWASRRLLVAVSQVAQRSAEQNREAVDCRPYRILDGRAAGGLQDPCFDELVERSFEEVEWTWLVVGSTLQRVLQHGE